MFKFLQNKRENVLTSQVSIKMVACPFREYLRDIYTKKNMLHVTAVAEEKGTVGRNPCRPKPTRLYLL
jgi:hypothetical protein